ncbi:MAG: hypothetical protein MZW92_26615 [Comamonadaceae bacterium]|nr:hypothetical protein [Comamonadaceae bacterium]
MSLLRTFRPKTGDLQPAAAARRAAQRRPRLHPGRREAGAEGTARTWLAGGYAAPRRLLPPDGRTARAALPRTAGDAAARKTCGRRCSNWTSYRPERGLYHYWSVYDRSATIALVRVALFTGMPAEELKRMSAAIEALDGLGRDPLRGRLRRLRRRQLPAREFRTWRWDLAVLKRPPRCPCPGGRIWCRPATGRSLASRWKAARCRTICVWRWPNCCCTGRERTRCACSTDSTRGPPMRCAPVCWCRPAGGRRVRRRSRRR